MPSETRRPRNAEATRDAILQAAIRGFARAGYDGIGVREIAGDAGVTAMLVNRYFGSKQGLFAEAVDVAFAPPVIVPEGDQSLGRAAVEALVARSDATSDDMLPFLILLKSVSNPDAAVIVRDAIERHVGHRLAGRLPAPGRQIRGDVLLSVISGVLLMRRVVGTRALNTRSTQRLETLLEAVFDAVSATELD